MGHRFPPRICNPLTCSVGLTTQRRALISAVLIYLLAGDLVSCEDCTKVSDCAFSCSGEAFDLSPLGDTSGNPKYKDIAPVVGEYQYSYNPCYPFTEADISAYPNECTNVASCQKIGSTGSVIQYYDCGVQSSVVFQKLPGNEISSLIESTDLFIVASYTSAANGRQSKVLLDCAATESFTVIGEDSNNINIYVYLLQTPLACGSSSGLSIGSILVIIFFVLLIVYAIGGVLFMKVRRGASGVELIPNRETWTAIPALIKGGVIFLSRGCKAGSSNYEKL